MQIAQNRVNESSLHAELKIESELMRFTTICTVLAEGIETLDDVKYTQEIPFYKNQFEKLFTQNTDLLSLFYIKEKSFNQTGFDYFSFERVGNDVVLSDELDFEPEIKDFYHDTMLNAKASISEPATYRYSVSQGRRIQQVIITTPIFKNGIFNGLVGLTISLAELNRICSEATALKDSFTFIVTKKGTIVGHVNSSMDGLMLSEMINEYPSLKKGAEDLHSGLPFDIEGSNILFKENSRAYFIPLSKTCVAEKWYLVVVVPFRVLYEPIYQTFIYSLIVLLLSLALLYVVVRRVIKSIFFRISQITNAVTVRIQALLEGEEINNIGPVFKNDPDFVNIFKSLDSATDDVSALWEKVRRSESFLKTLFDFIPDPVFAIDARGRVIAWNMAIARLSGRTKEEMLGRSNYAYGSAFYGAQKPMLIDLVFAHDEELSRTYMNFGRDADTVEGEFFTDHFPSGGKKWLWGKASALYNSKGEITGAVEIIRDITKERFTEKILKDSEKTLSAIIDFLPDATFAIDINGSIISWNRAMEEMTGCTKASMLGKSNYEYALPFYHERRKELCDLVLIDDKIASNNYTNIKRKGRSLVGETYSEFVGVKGVGSYLWAIAAPLEDANGTITGAIESIRDISDRKRFEKEIKELNTILEQKVLERTSELDTANQELLERNKDLHVTLLNLNKAQDQLILKEKLAALGQILAGIAHELNTPLGALLSSGKMIANLVHVNVIQAAKTLSSLKGTDLRSALHLLERIVKTEFLTTSSISGRKEKRRIAEKLKEEKIVDAEDLAEILYDLGLLNIDASVLNIAKLPQANEIFVSLDSFASLLKMSDVSIRAAEKANHVVRALKNYLYKEVEERVYVNLEAEFETLLTLYHNQIKQGIKLVMEFPGDSIVYADRNSLNQVWMNLIQNALQAMNYKGTLSIEIKKNQKQIEVRIRDNGPGISESIKNHIFEPFFTTKRKGEGTGLGLDISKKIIEQHDGTIAYESEVGNTVFIVTLPSAPSKELKE